jgi:hypothetical protein
MQICSIAYPLSSRSSGCFTVGVYIGNSVNPTISQLQCRRKIRSNVGEESSLCADSEPDEGCLAVGKATVPAYRRRGRQQFVWNFRSGFALQNRPNE